MLVSNRRFIPVIVEPGNFWSPDSPKVVYVQPADPLAPGRNVLVKTVSPDLSRLFLGREARPPRDRKPPRIDYPAPKREKREWKFDEFVDDLKKDSVISGIKEDKVNVTKEEPSDVFTEIPLTKEPEREEPNPIAFLFDQLLSQVYTKKVQKTSRRKSELIFSSSRPWESLCRHNSCPSHLDRRVVDKFEKYSKDDLLAFSSDEVRKIRREFEERIRTAGNWLAAELQDKDMLTTDQEGLCGLITAFLQANSSKTRDDARLRFSISPVTTDQSGFQEWARAMRMVARLPDGVPAHFRKNLWLSLAERHLNTKGHTNWQATERRLFSETTSSEDRELSVQIVKDLHRTGCSLFCGATGQHNQAVLKRVLLAYARWNKNVGYCQGLNMLAALILQVMQGSQSATVKVMIYLIEGVLPESYFGNNLRGLSVDMAVFRDLLKLKVPELSRHLDQLQQESKDSGTSYEPPLCDVFTMQWFLTLFSTCLPQSTVLRVWDLVFLEGDQILLRTALAIWDTLSERMMAVRSADEFYSIMAVLTREMMEFGLMEPNNLIKVIDRMSTPEVTELREKYVFNISPWAVSTVAKMGLKLFYPDTYDQAAGGDDLRQSDVKMTPFSNHPDREKIALDISALKRQYWKLRERQRQAHIILSACRSETLATGNSPALNHLLLGKRALLSAKGRKIEGAIPMLDKKRETRDPRGQTLHWKDAGRDGSRSPSPSSSSSSSSSTELCDSSDSDNSTDERLTKDDEKIEEEPPRKGEEDRTLDNVKKERRKSEIALLQILQENSEILQRIQSHRIDEPEDIREIRRKYSRVSFDPGPSDQGSSGTTTSPPGSPSARPQPLPDLPRFSPFPTKSPRKKEVGIGLGLYSSQDS
ncbi:TBC1 domain family member 30-like isoform X2 [Cimex lectularius]|nr:TBC1 domain family member 30-like isoform X2 [Cimex lectularius]